MKNEQMTNTILFRKSKRTKLASEPFVGMWRNRKDLQDSRAWVRGVREREWMKQ